MNKLYRSFSPNFQDEPSPLFTHSLPYMGVDQLKIKMVIVPYFFLSLSTNFLAHLYEDYINNERPVLELESNIFV